MMEKKEAIELLREVRNMITVAPHREAIQTALDALKWLDEEEEHERRFDDLIGRQQAIEELYDVFFDDELSAAYPEEADKVLDVIRKLPSASYQQVKKSDYISRQSAIISARKAMRNETEDS